MAYIFLTHNIEQLDKPMVHKIFEKLMFSIEPLYEKVSLGKYVGFRRIFSNHVIAYDSGGFAFLLGKIKQPPDPGKTVRIYKSLGFNRKDFLIQLDLPPQYFMCKEERIALIVKSAQYYHYMRSKLNGNVVGVVHGWDLEELKLSLELLLDPDKIALGTYIPVTKPYAMKTIGLGSYAARAVLPEKTVATPSCLAESKTFFKTLGNKLIGLGSYANTKNSIAWSRKTIATPSGNAEKVLQRVPKKVVYERLTLAFNLLRDYEVFCLGGSGPNTAHLIFYLGAKYIDGSSWRLAALLWRIYVPELGEFSVGKKKIAKRLNDRAIAKIREYYYESPLRDISFNHFIAKIKQNGTEAFVLRALWNAYVMKVEEEIANNFACDPDRYYKYLSKRWSNSPWRRVLDFVTRRLKQHYVQYRLTLFLKN